MINCKLLTVFCILTLIISRCSGASPKTRLCPSVNRIAWMEEAPYVEFMHGHTNHSNGIIMELMEKALRSCCRGELNYDVSATFKTQDQVSDIPLEYTIDYILPVQRALNAKNQENFPFVTLVQSPGLAFFILPGQEEGKALLQGMNSLKPLIILMFLFVSISGVCFWLCENIALSFTNEKPTPFERGIFSGFWWSFVTMTTVGYGDVLPSTKPARIFSVVWVLFGTVFCAMLTGSMTTVLQVSLMGSEVSLTGTEVAVLKGGEEYKYAVMKQAIPRPFDNVSSLLDAIRENKVTAALLDVYVAAEHSKNLEVLQLQEIIEHVFSIGVVFQNNGFYFSKCIRDYVLSRQMEVFELILKRVNFKSLSTKKTQPTSSSIDYKKPSFYLLVLGLLGSLVVMLLVGYVIERIYLWNKRRRERGKEPEKELTLTEWRMEYKAELYIVVKAIFEDMQRIKEKAEGIRERYRNEIEYYQL